MNPVDQCPIVDENPTAGDPVALTLSSIAVAISLLVVVLPFITGILQRRRDDRALRSGMYLELMESVEKHGLWAVDRTYDLTETSNDEYFHGLPHRNPVKPDRSERVRARAIVSAYASTKVSRAYVQWSEALQAFEDKLDLFSLLAQEDGPDSVPMDTLKPLSTDEIDSREALADQVNKELLQDRRWWWQKKKR